MNKMIPNSFFINFLSKIKTMLDTKGFFISAQGQI